MKWERVSYVGTYPEACLVRSRLEEAGFHAAPIPEAEHVFLAGADRVYFIEVLSDEADSARAILAELGYSTQLLP